MSIVIVERIRAWNNALPPIKVVGAARNLIVIFAHEVFKPAFISICQ